MFDRSKSAYRWPLLASILLPLSVLYTACSPRAQFEPPGQADPGGSITAPRIELDPILSDLEYLSSDELLGRRTGTPGNELARVHLIERFQEVGLQPLGDSFSHEFSFTGRGGGEEEEGVNIVGYHRGQERPEEYIIITAHYDHLGVGEPDERGDSIYNGADDNAAGAAALIALADHLRTNPPAHSVIFAAFDAEELGLQGARAFVAEPPVPLESIVLNINMDMISRNDRNELYAAGTHHYPFLVPYVKRAAERSAITLLMGHDYGEVRAYDWTNASDHGAFHARGIPFIYFGVEDHEDYHRPSDEFSKIHPEFYREAVETILDLFLEIDAEPPRWKASRVGGTR